MSKNKTPTPEPIIQALSVIRKEGYWQVMAYQVQGDKVLSATPIGETTIRSDAIHRFKIEFSRRFMADV